MEAMLAGGAEIPRLRSSLIAQRPVDLTRFSAHVGEDEPALSTEALDLASGLRLWTPAHRGSNHRRFQQGRGGGMRASRRHAPTTGRHVSAVIGILNDAVA